MVKPSRRHAVEEPRRAPSELPRFIPIESKHVPAGMVGVTALVHFEGGVGTPPSCDINSTKIERLAESVLGEVGTWLYKEEAVKRRNDVWMAVSLFVRLSEDSPPPGSFRRICDYVYETLRSLNGGVIERCDILRVEGQAFCVGVRAEWLFRREAAMREPSAAFLASLTNENSRCLYRRVRRERAKQRGDQENELAERLLGRRDEGARVAAAKALADIANQNKLSLTTVKTVGGSLPDLPAAAIVMLCPVISRALSATDDRNVEEIRRGVAERTAGLLFSSDNEIGVAARNMFSPWRKIDPLIAAGLDLRSDTVPATEANRAGSTKLEELSIASAIMMSAQETIQLLRELREPEQIEQFLERCVVGKRWGNLKDNQDVAYALTDHLRGLNLGVACAKDGEPARLRAVRTGGAPDGAFYFEHTVDGIQRRHGGTKAVPKLKIGPAPPDLRRRISGGTH